MPSYRKEWDSFDDLNGPVSFLELVGITDEELAWCNENSVHDFEEKLQGPPYINDFERRSVV